MQIWEVLGIKKTKDKSVIKSAYREKLRVTNPEDDAEGFKLLRKAFEEANKYADSPDSENETAAARAKRDSYVPVNDFDRELNELYADFYRRIDENEWKRLLDSDYAVALDTSEEAFDLIIKAMMRNMKLPNRIITLVAEHYDMEERKNELIEKYPSDFIYYYISRIKKEDFIVFDSFKGPREADYDGFIDAYINMDKAIAEENGEKQDELIEKLDSFEILNPMLYIIKARYHYQKKEADVSLQIISEGLEEYPDDAGLLVSKGDYCYLSGDREVANQCYEKANEINPDDFTVKAKVANMYCDNGEYVKARDIFISIMKVKHYDPNVRMGVIRANEGIISKNTKILEENPEDEKARMEMAWAYFQCYKFDEAIDTLKKIEPSHELGFEYYNVLGRSFVGKGDRENAKKCFFKWKELIEGLDSSDKSEETEKKRVRYPYVHFLIGDCYLKLGDYDKAREYVLKALETKHDEQLLSYEALCEIYYLKGEYENALKAADELEKVDRGTYVAWYTRAMCYYELGLLQESLNSCERAIAVFPLVIEAYDIEMKIFMKVRQYEHVRKVIKRYESFGIESHTCMLYRAKLLLVDNDEENAFAILKQINQRIIENEEANAKRVTDIQERDAFYVLLGEMCQRYKDEYAAVELYKKAVAVNEKNTYAHGYLGRYYRAIGKYEEALTEYSRQLELRETTDYYIERGYINRVLRNNEAACADFKKAISMDPKKYKCYKIYADFLMAIGKFPEAMENYDKAVGLTSELSERWAINLKRAEIFKKQRYYEASCNVYKEIIAETGLIFEVVNKYCDMLKMAGWFDEAFSLMRKYKKRLADNNKPCEPSVDSLIMSIYCCKGDADEATNYFAKMIKENRLTVDLCRQIGYLYLREGLFSNAEKVFLKAMELDKDHKYNFYSELAEAASNQVGGFIRTKKYISKMKERQGEPKTMSDYVSFARIAIIEKRYDDAAGWFDKAKGDNSITMSDEEVVNAFIEIGKMFEAKKDKDSAIETYEEALKTVGYNKYCLRRLHVLKNME